MKAEPIFIFGAGGHAKVILEICEDAGRPIHHIYADGPPVDSLFGYPVKCWDPAAMPIMDGIIAIGDNRVRYQVASRLGTGFATVINRNCYISPRSVLGAGTAVVSGATIHSDTSVGMHSIVNTHASVDHDCQIGDFVHIAPGAVLCGGVCIGSGTLVGAGAVIIPGVKIGCWAVIGAGSVIRHDIPDGAIVAGNPGRIFKSGTIIQDDKSVS
jgi:sugar O-acyltransferase (sialic acid O-acetyltransferase NeuD family)